MLNTGKLAGKTVYITGASRGIGEGIGLKCAKDGANVVIAAKTTEPHPTLPGTIYTAAKKMDEAGGKGLALMVDIRDEEAVAKSIEETVRHFGGIDILVNNASAIALTGTEVTPMKRYDLMHTINTRGTYMVTKYALPYLKNSKKNPHILNISPPLNMKPRWFRDHCAYTMAKYGMSMCVLGMAEEFKDFGIGVNALWPRTAIMTAAMEMLGGGAGVADQCRTTDIMSDAAYVMLTRDGRNYSGNFAIDEAVLMEEGMKDFSQYACVPGQTEFMPDFFLDDFDDYVKGHKEVFGKSSQPAMKEYAAPAAEKSTGLVQPIFDQISSLINPDLVNKMKTVYAFDITGNESGKWYLDLKNGAGSCGKGEASTDADCTFKMKDEHFQQMFTGKLKPASAFMTGKMKLQGDMGKALKLEKVMGQMKSRSYHTMMPNHQRAYDQLFSKHRLSNGFHTTAQVLGDYSSVQEVLDRISAVKSEAIVKQVGAIYLFDVKEKGKYHIDFKNGSGAVGEGEAPTKADVTISMNEEVFLKIFNRELAPASAFMTGKVKVSGDLAKALTLEKVMKATREAAEAAKNKGA